MPNTGKPSRGCHLCRARRVKCDLTRPGCSRCTKLGKTCPGYRQESELWFRNENIASYAKTHVDEVSRRKTRAQSEHAVPVQDEEWLSCSFTTTPASLSSFSDLDSFEPTATMYSDDLSPAHLSDSGELHFSNSPKEDSITLLTQGKYISMTSALLPLSPPIPDHWEDSAIPLILDRFSAPFGGGRFLGMIDFLPGLYQNICEDSCLMLASKAVAGAYWTNRPSSALTISDRARIYGKALGSTNQALQDLSEGIKDATVIAIWLLSIYEILVGAPRSQKFAGPGAWHAHSQGLVALLNLRGREQFATAGGRRIFRLIYEMIQARCFVANVECPKESLGWFEILQAHLTEYDEPAFVVSVYAYKVSCILPRIRNLVTRGNVEDAFSHAANLLAECDTIDADMLTWLHSDIILSKLHPGDLSLLPTWNMYRAVRGMLYQSLVAFFDLLKDPCNIPFTLQFINERHENSILIVQRMINEILDTIPYALGDQSTRDDDLQLTRPRAWSDALRLLWPLRTVSFSPLTLPHQRETAKRALCRIGYEMGIHQALV